MSKPDEFYGFGQPCESCGSLVMEERHRPYWDPDLLVGPCCSIHSDEWIDDTEPPACEVLYQAVRLCGSVREVREVFKLHAESKCSVCFPERKPVQPATTPVKTEGDRKSAPGERKAA